MPQNNYYRAQQHGPQPGPQQGPAVEGAYQRRYQRNAGTAMDQIYGSGPYIVALVSFLIMVGALVSLQAVDIITGRFSQGYMSDMNYGWYFSLATTGIVLAVVGAAMYAWKERWDARIVLTMVILALIPICIDIYFDALSVDIIKYHRFITLSELPFADRIPYTLFRVMVGALSAIGEPLAAASVILFPVMKELFKGVME